MIALAALLISSLLSSANANPCLALQGLNSQEEFNAILKEIKPTSEQFDVLMDCWAKKKPVVLSEAETYLYQPLKKYLDGRTSAEKIVRIRALEMIFEIDSKVRKPDVSAKPPQIGILVKRLEEIPAGDAGKAYSIFLQFYNEYLESNEVTNKVKFSEDTVYFYERFLQSDHELSNAVLASQQIPFAKEFEDQVRREFLTNADFLNCPPHMGGMAGNLTTFRSDTMKAFIESELPKLSEGEQNNFIRRLVKYSGRFDDLLDAKYLPRILNLIGSSRFFDPFRANDILKQLEHTYSKDLKGQYNQLYQEKALYLIKLASTQPNPVRGLSVLSDHDAEQIKAKIRVYQLAHQATEAKPETMSKEQFEIMQKTPPDECNGSLQDFSPN